MVSEGVEGEASVSDMDCIFCDILAGRVPGEMPVRWADAVALVPLNPVTPGHILILPRQHVRDAVENQRIAAAVMRRAVTYIDEVYGGKGDFNLVASVGPAATQTVWHYHLHIVPRRPDDGLKLPWSADPDAVS